MIATMCLYGRRKDIMYERKTKIGMEKVIETGNESLNYLTTQQKLNELEFLKTRQVNQSYFVT